MTRRALPITIVSGLFLTLSAFSFAEPANAAPPICFPVPVPPFCLPVPGIAGGGSLAVETGTARLSLFATSITPEGVEGAGTATFGQVRWWAPGENDDTPLLLESTVVEEYGPMPGEENGRVIRGFMSANGVGEYPFAVWAIDGGLSNEAVDFVEIRVGNAVEGTNGSGFTYAAEGQLENGDFQLLNFVDPVEPAVPTVEPTEAEPSY